MRGLVAILCSAVACSFNPPAAVDPDASGGTVDATGGPGDDACGNCPSNDVASGAIQINGSGRITATLANAHDDTAASCGGSSGRDLFFELNVPSPQVVYVDTVGSNVDAVLSVYSGPCSAPSTQLACADNPCTGSTHAQLAASLSAGKHCLVVDEGATSASDPRVELDVMFANRDGIALTGSGPWTLSGNTCNGTNISTPSCEADAGTPGNAKELMYWFTVCPGDHSVSASTCNDVDYDSIVYLLSDSGELACRDDGCSFGRGSSMTSSATGNGLMMVVVDGWDGECGPFSLDVEL